MVEAKNTEPLNVLFVGDRNSVRSIMAEAILNREGMGRFRAVSAGCQASGAVHPYVLELLSGLKYDVRECRSKNWLEFMGPNAPALHFVFTVGDDATCATGVIWPGHPTTAHWGVPDPSAATGKEAEIRLAFLETYRMLSNRIIIFTSLPIQSLDQSSLRQQLGLIARGRATFKRSAAAA
jgi:protein-tyrosine-phosphatase